MFHEIASMQAVNTQIKELMDCKLKLSNVN